MKFRKTVADLVDDRLARLIKRMRKLKPATIPYSASATFFAIPELRDLVLEHLDFVELFAVRRVCRGWDESIRTHSALRRTTNLDPRVRTQVEKQTLPRDLGSEDTGVPSQVYRVLPRFFKDKMLPQKFEVGPFTCKRYEMRNIADTETLYIRDSKITENGARRWDSMAGFHAYGDGGGQTWEQLRLVTVAVPVRLEVRLETDALLFCPPADPKRGNPVQMHLQRIGRDFGAMEATFGALAAFLGLLMDEWWRVQDEALELAGRVDRGPEWAFGRWHGPD